MKKRWRRIVELTDKEIKALLDEMIAPKRVFDIERNKEDNTVSATIVTEWGENHDEIEDVIDLFETEYNVDFLITPEDQWKYRQYLFALGVNPLTIDNPYLK